jgi:branched-chain amino acid transport system substrate-binding protein
MRQIGMNIQIIGAQGMATPDYALVGKEAAEGTVFTSPLNYGNPLPEEKMLFDNYLIEYKKPPSPFAAHGWDAFMLVIEAIKRSNSTDPDKMQAALENLKGYKGAMGVFNFSPDNHDGLSLDAVSYIKVKEGKWLSVQ